MKMRMTGLVVSGGIFCVALGILSLSFWKHVGNQVEEQVLAREAVVLVSDQPAWKNYTNAEVRKPQLPGHLGYMIQAGRDRLSLWWIKDPDTRCLKLLQLAEKRMSAVDELMLMGEGRLAVQTTFKGVYYWEAARNFLTDHDQQSEQHGWLWQHLYEDGNRYIDQLRLMKATLSEPALSGLDRLIETLTLGQERVKERIGNTAD